MRTKLQPLHTVQRNCARDGEVTGPILAILGFTFGIAHRPRNTHHLEAHLRRSTACRHCIRLHSTTHGQPEATHMVFRRVASGPTREGPHTQRTGGLPNHNQSTGDGIRYPWKKRMLQIRKLFRRLGAGHGSQEEERMVAELAKYEGVVLSPPSHEPIKSMPVPWALQPHERAGLSGLDVFNEELIRFTEHLRLSELEQAARQQVIFQLKHTIEGVLQRHKFDYNVVLSGSTVTGLAVSTSDIDVVLEATAYTSVNQRKKLLSLISTELDTCPDFTIEDELLLSWRPLIGVQHRPTSIRVQLVGNVMTTKQQAATTLYLQQNPALRTVFLALRTTLEVRGLLDPYHGGISSWTLLAMTRAALLQLDQATLQAASAAEQLLYVLDFYTNLDTSKTGIHAHDGALYAKKDNTTEPSADRLRKLIPSSLSIRCPVYPENDLGQGMYAIKHIRKTFGALATEARKRISLINLPGTAGDDLGEAAVLEVVVGRVHELQYEYRARLEEFGARSLQSSEPVASNTAENMSHQGRRSTLATI